MWELEFAVNNGLVFHILARMLHILVYVRMLVRTKFDAHSRSKSNEKINSDRIGIVRKCRPSVKNNMSDGF